MGIPGFAGRSFSDKGPCFGIYCPFYMGSKFLTNNSSCDCRKNDYNSLSYVLTGAEYFALVWLEVCEVNFIFDDLLRCLLIE